MPVDMGRRRPARTRRPALAALIAGVLVALVLPALAAAHPLGNFTINHYAGLRVEPDRVLLDLVIDQAEIPTFQAHQALDTDGDGLVSVAETATGRVSTCEALLGDVTLTIDGAVVAPRLTGAGLTFPAGAGGLPTMRSVCAAEAPLVGSTTPRLTFHDASFAERLGWREIVVVGSGMTVAAADPATPVRAAGVSDRLTAYPADLVARPLADAAVEVAVTAGGPTLPAWSFADAPPVGTGVAVAPPAASPAPVEPGPAAVPGGIEGDLPAIFRSPDLTPLVLLLSLLTAAALGAGHALTPGHGKTLMAAYLVGTRGTILHAVGLGLSVSLSHTVGILVLAGVVLGAADVLPADVVVRTAPVIAALSILAIGGWMLLGEWRRRRATRAHAHAHEQAHTHDHEHPHEHEHTRDHDPLEHEHGGVRHSHAPARGSTVTWRSLFALGLAGGLIPSTSALLILLGAIAAGRPGFGLVLVVAFGLGMAAVMGGIGIALVVARGRLDRLPAGGSLGRVGAAVPLVAAILVFGFGIWLTAGAIGSAGVL